MPKRNQYDWLAIEAMYMTGESPAAIAKLPNMPRKQTIYEYAQKHGWQRLDDVPKLSVIPFEGLTEKQQIVVTELADGATQKMAAAIVGVSQQTVSEWKKDLNFRKACMAAVATHAKGQLKKITNSTDWRAAGWYLERNPETREDFAPPNASRGMVGTTFNVLGHVNVGIDRDANIGVSENGIEPIAAPTRRLSHESTGEG